MFNELRFCIVSRMRFGSLTLKSNLFLSPLAGYTNLPFRLAVRELGGLDLATTDLVNARSLLQVGVKEIDDANTIFDELMGDKVEPRRVFIEEHALTASVDA